MCNVICEVFLRGDGIYDIAHFFINQQSNPIHSVLHSSVQYCCRRFFTEHYQCSSRSLVCPLSLSIMSYIVNWSSLILIIVHSLPEYLVVSSSQFLLIAINSLTSLLSYNYSLVVIAVCGAGRINLSYLMTLCSPLFLLQFLFFAQSFNVDTNSISLIPSFSDPQLAKQSESSPDGLQTTMDSYSKYLDL
jgi:hypothetical protein